MTHRDPDADEGAEPTRDAIDRNELVTAARFTDSAPATLLRAGVMHGAAAVAPDLRRGPGELVDGLGHTSVVVG